MQATLDKAPKRDLMIFMVRDLNAQVGPHRITQTKNSSWTDTELENRIKTANFSEFWTFNDLIIRGTLFIHKTTWISPDVKTDNQIYNIGRMWRSLHDVRVKCGADTASYHHLVVVTLKTKLKTYNDQAGSHKFNVLMLKKIVEEFKVEQNKFSVFSQLQDLEEIIEEQWHIYRKSGQQHVMQP